MANRSVRLATLGCWVGRVLRDAPFWIVPVVRDSAGWGWAFVLLVPEPILGMAAMSRLAGAAQAELIAGGRG